MNIYVLSESRRDLIHSFKGGHVDVRPAGFLLEDLNADKSREAGRESTVIVC